MRKNYFLTKQSFTFKSHTMIKKVNILFFLTLLCFALVWTSCSTSKTKGPSYVGKWRYEVPDMQGTNTGILVISKEGDAYKCVALTDDGYEQLIDNFDITDGKISASYDSMGTLVEFDGLFDGNNLSGILSAEGMSMGYTATKVE